MTPERLAEIEEIIADYVEEVPRRYIRAAVDLLAEVKRLRAELERVREAAVAGGYAQDGEVTIMQQNED